MNNSFLGGLLFGFVIVFGIFLMVSFLARKGKNAHYDERQKIIRGEGYKISFITVSILNFVYGCMVYDSTSSIIAPQLVVITIALIGLLIYTLYCIFNDAYLQVGQKIGKWIGLIIFVIIGNGYAAFSNSKRDFNIKELANVSLLNIIIVIFFSIVLISFLIKQYMLRKDDNNEES